MLDLYCKVCLASRTGDVAGANCQSSECGGIIEERPKFSDLVDELPEPQSCGRRGDNMFPIPVGLDRWLKFKTNGNRVCSYCGSLHPDDMFALVKQSGDAPIDALHGSVIEIEQSDKSYKIYVQQPDVRNAHEGGIKFYTHHLPQNDDGEPCVTQEQNAEYSKAVKQSRERFMKRLYGDKK